MDGATPETGRMPNMVFLYRRAILDYWAEHEETLGAIVTHVLVHEIGHHFGLSDDDMYAIEDRFREPGGDRARRDLDSLEAVARSCFHGGPPTPRRRG